jgi:hypothetical protein
VGNYHLGKTITPTFFADEPSNFCNGACSDAEALAAARAILASAEAAGSSGGAINGGGSVDWSGRYGVPTPMPAPGSDAAAALAAEAARPAVHPSAHYRSGPNPGDPKFPPYLPGRLGGATLLEEKTVAMAARQTVGMHYNAHKCVLMPLYQSATVSSIVCSLYGWSEGVATTAALETVRGKRAMVISRSTFASSGAHNGHWLGDNNAAWQDLYYSIPGTLVFNMLGVVSYLLLIVCDNLTNPVCSLGAAFGRGGHLWVWRELPM